jgi:glycosyltransferase involved in cell wall biosynthesis
MKDHGTFAAAARILCQRLPEVRFLCVGDGIEPYRSTALAYLRTGNLDGRVRWEGFIADMPAFFNALDVATLTSAFGEGFSNAIAEAMACGVPCVATDVGDARTIIGDTGRVVPPGDAASLAAAWQDALESRTHGPNLECRARIVEHFSVSRLVTDTERLILPPASRRSPSVQL